MKLNLDKITKIDSSYPVIIIDNFISILNSKKIINEINLFSKFDDNVMNGRNRINKGSKNFKIFLKNSKISSVLYQNINKFSFFKKIYKLINDYEKKQRWFFNSKDIKSFSIENYGKQKDTFFDSLMEILKIYNLKKTTLNLDIDFSKSQSGYNRGPHRDRDSRIINFLLYLNDIKKKEGGCFEVYNLKSKMKNYEYPRFPQIKSLKLVKKITPKAGTIVIFKSFPDSYHAVSKFSSKGYRYFIYGSFSLNKPVKWIDGR